jgi:hypothetical protein
MCVHNNTRVVVRPGKEGKYNVYVYRWGAQTATGFCKVDLPLTGNRTSFIVEPELKRSLEFKFSKGSVTVTEVQRPTPKSDPDGPRPGYRVATVCQKTSNRIPTEQEIEPGSATNLADPVLK